MFNGERSEGQVGNIKSNLEEWREVVIKADAVLGWEEDWYPAVTGGVLTAAFLFIWYWDPTLLTFFAFMGLIVTLTDYLGPKIISQVRINHNTSTKGSGRILENGAFVSNTIDFLNIILWLESVEIT